MYNSVLFVYFLILFVIIILFLIYVIIWYYTCLWCLAVSSKVKLNYMRLLEPQKLDRKPSAHDTEAVCDGCKAQETTLIELI